MLPFTVEQFLAVFVTYNEAIWPAQILAYVAGGLAFALVFRGHERSDRTIAGILAAMWAWTGLAYHLTFFTVINRMAYGFSALFFVQAAAFAYTGAYQGRIKFGSNADPGAWIGTAFVFYAAIAYPLLGLAMGHSFLELPMFGVTPCPVTIFTFGMLLLTRQPVPRLLLAIPVLWSLVGGSAAMLLRVPQDWLLLVSGAIAVALLIRRDRRLAPA